MSWSAVAVRLSVDLKTVSAWWQQQQSHDKEANCMKICAMESDRQRSESYQWEEGHGNRNRVSGSHGLSPWGALTWMPPTPMTEKSWPMKREARKLRRAVPARERRSEKRLRRRQRESLRQMVWFCLVLVDTEEGNGWKKNYLGY